MSIMAIFGKYSKIDTEFVSVSINFHVSGYNEFL